jgi:hypothetical protein
LKHSQTEHGYIEVGRAGSVAVAQVHPRRPADEFFLVEKLIGRITAWFADEIVAINIQFVPDDSPRKAKKQRAK